MKKVQKILVKNFKRLRYYFRIWLIMSKNSFLVMLSRKKMLFLFLVGKLLRFAFFTIFLFSVVNSTGTLAGYGVNETIFFFMTFIIIDTITQFLFREVYRFRPLVVKGDLDLILTKPRSTLFRVLMGGSDVTDLITIPIFFAAAYFVGSTLNPSVTQITLFLVLIVNGLFIATAFHIAVLAFGIITFEIDHTIMIYRDVSNLGRLPVDIYRQPLRSFLTFLIPVGIMITLPARGLMGLATPTGIAIAFIVGLGSVYLSLRLWFYALKQYSSASS